jgi:hypothetical protein
VIQLKELNNANNHTNYTQYMADRFDINTLVELRKDFIYHKKKGTILLCEFEDEIWSVSAHDGIRHKIYFSLDKNIKENLKLINISDRDFIDALKYFCILRLNSKPALSVKENIGLILNLTCVSDCYCHVPEITINEYEMKLVIYWFDWVAIEASDFLETLTSSIISSKKSNARVLSDFQTYFKFDKEIREFWKIASAKDKLFYYPLWLFWIITTILPMRVCEFAAMPYDCISPLSNKWFITIRRLKIKGHNKFVHNDLNDFKLCTYKVSEDIAVALNGYKKILEENSFHELQRIETRLFNTQLLKMYAPYPIYQDLSTYFTTNHLRKLKDKFMQEIIIKKMQYNLVTRDITEEKIKSGFIEAELDLNEISEWCCGDTRHLAMINLIMKGCSPMLIKEFAGHATSDMSAHYYSNAYKMIKASLFKEIGSKRVIDIPQSKKLSLVRCGENDCVPCPGGYCRSINYILGSGVDCIKVKRCESCHYLIRQGAITIEEHDWHSNRIQSDFNSLLKLVFCSTENDHYKIESIIHNLLRKQRQYAKAINDEREVIDWEISGFSVQSN